MNCRLFAIGASILVFGLGAQDEQPTPMEQMRKALRESPEATVGDMAANVQGTSAIQIESVSIDCSECRLRTKTSLRSPRQRRLR